MLASWGEWLLFIAGLGLGAVAGALLVLYFLA